MKSDAGNVESKITEHRETGLLKLNCSQKNSSLTLEQSCNGSRQQRQTGIRTPTGSTSKRGKAKSNPRKLSSFYIQRHLCRQRYDASYLHRPQESALETGPSSPNFIAKRLDIHQYFETTRYHGCKDLVLGNILHDNNGQNTCAHKLGLAEALHV
jgi:hypothetical protein